MSNPSTSACRIEAPRPGVEELDTPWEPQSVYPHLIFFSVKATFSRVVSDVPKIHTAKIVRVLL